MSETSNLSIAFYGKDAEECEEFIRQVRIYAFKEGKKDDDTWIAGQVYPCFGGKALRWYLKQPRDIRGDWELLQQALIQEWPEIRDERSAQPTPAAAPPSAGNVLQQPAIGRGSNPVAPKTGPISVKFPNNPRIIGYVSKKVSGQDGPGYFAGSFPITTDLSEILEVRLCQTDTPNIWRLGVKDLPGVEYLATYPPGGSDFKKVLGVIIGVQRAPIGRSGESTTYTSTSASYLNHLYHTDVWEIGSQGALTFRCPAALGNAAVNIIVYDSTYLGMLDESVNLATYQKAELAFIETSS